ncbi:hypothetical protein [Streptosporangium sp. NPDC020145]|uniref:hypothetical protein n=1 Tax=Streptosporangium sp. NPDC020145 TaxID=3154694 RepID=UPI003427BA5F
MIRHAQNRPEPAPALAVPISTGAVLRVVAAVAAPFTVEAPLGKARPRTGLNPSSPVTTGRQAGPRNGAPP